MFQGNYLLENSQFYTSYYTNEVFKIITGQLLYFKPYDSGLPWGSMMPPIGEIHIHTSWPILSEDLIEDTLEYTDLDPLQGN